MAKGIVQNQPTAEAPKVSALEGIKESSRQLRGTIAEKLRANTDQFEEADKQLLKFHGSYQQVDRDSRKERRKEGLGKHFMFMVRCKIPGGRLTADQYLAVDELADKYASGTLRITTRQGIQLHGVLKSNLKETIAGINDCLLTTLGACGDVNRNVMICPAPNADGGLHEQLEKIGKKLAARFAPRSSAYHEIWLNGKSMPVELNGKGKPGKKTEDEEPIYGKFYLPRKFKIGLALPENNLIDIYAQDLGLLAIVQDGKIVGYNVLAGGGMGMTHNKPETFPYIAKPICYIPAQEVIQTAEGVLKLFRDHGNRENRKRARLKYVLHDWGVEKFRNVLAEYVGHSLDEPKPVEATGFDLCLGWHPQQGGKYWYGVGVLSGRIKDEGDFRLRTALRKIMEKFKPEVRLTPMQDILLCGLEESARADIEKILRKHGVQLPYELPTLKQFSMSCPAIPTCGLALSEAERTLPDLTDQLQSELERLGLDKEEISVRMTGCPNGCARPYQSDIGIVGRSGTKYTLFLGGNVLGNRLNFLFQDLVPVEEIVPTLVPLLENYKKNHQKGEGFGDWCHRVGIEKLIALLPDHLRKPMPKHHEPAGYRVPEKEEIPLQKFAPSRDGQASHARLGKVD